MVQKVKIVDFRFSWTTMRIPDPDPAKWYGFLRIRIRNTDYF